MTPAELSALVRDVPDFPKPGITFKDITPLLADATALAEAVRLMGEPHADSRITKVVGIEARGFIFAAPIALTLEAGFVPLRKAGKLPYSTLAREYDLEYGTACLEIHADAVGEGDRVLIVDDVLATGGTAAAAMDLIESTGAEVVGLAFLLEIGALRGVEALNGVNYCTLLEY